MANTLRIKRSQVTATPTSLAEGELAYSFASGVLALYIGDAVGGVHKIGGELDVTKLAGIEAGATADQRAADVPHDPIVGLLSTHVQGALEQLATAGGGSASNTSYDDTSTNVTGTVPVFNVQDAIEAIDARLDALSSNGGGGTAEETSYNDAGTAYALEWSGGVVLNVQSALEAVREFLERLDTDSHTHANQAVLDDIDSAGSGDIITVAERNKLNGIEAGAAADQTAAEVTHTPIPTMTSTNVQAALAELAGRSGGTASGTSYDDTGTNISGGAPVLNVQSALEAVDSRMDDLESVTTTGQFFGTSDRYATLPVIHPSTGEAVSNGDWAMLTEPDGSLDQGGYVHNGTQYIWSFALAAVAYTAGDGMELDSGAFSVDTTVARRNADNTFNGNQQINGDVTGNGGDLSEFVIDGGTY